MRTRLSIFAFGTIRGLEQAERISSACLEIGAEIAIRGHELSIVSARLDTIDPHLVDGIKTTGGKHRVTVWRSETDERSRKGLRSDNIEILPKWMKGPYPISHFHAIKESNIALTIGGTHPLDLQIGHSTVALERPILTVPSFGGYSKEIWDLVLDRYYRDRAKIADEEIAILRSDWSEHSATVCVNVAEKLVASDIFRKKSSILCKPDVFTRPVNVMKEDQVAVMMPFAAEFTETFEAIERSCQAAGFRAVRADDIWANATFMQDIFELIYCSRIVIADLSNRNPNVMYEIGLAHTLGRPVVPIARSLKDIPSDLQQYRALQYLPNTEGFTLLEDSIKRRLGTIVGNVERGV